MPLRERARGAGLNPDRADIIVAGLLRVHDEGIRAGLLYEMVDAFNQTAPRKSSGDRPDRLRAVQAFASSCHHDHRHAEHVAHLALRLFDELAAARVDESNGWSTPANRELLHAAALLHDVGYLINYSKHHKHSHHLIIHSGLSGFSRRELSIVANIARYHRGARPKRKHSHFAQLNPADQDLVNRLAGIIRVAVGLDRSHAQRISDVVVHLDRDEAVIESVAEEEPDVELWGARRKSRLFSRIFDHQPRFVWRQAASASSHKPENCHVA